MENETENGKDQEEQETQSEENSRLPDEETGLKDRVTELEKTLAERDSEIGVLKQTGEELRNRCEVLGNSLGEAVIGYREMVVQGNPGIPGEMITGDTIEAVNESLESARVLVSRIRQGLESEIIRTKVPAGSPERNSPDLSSLTPGEKIRYALGGNE